MLYVLFGLAVAALVLAFPFASRRLRRVARAAVPVITDLPAGEEREPFAYGGIVAIGEPDEEGPSPA